MREKLWFASRLKAWRERRGMSQVELAAACGMPAAAINHFERGRRVPGLRNALVLARALGITVDEMLSDDSSLSARVAQLEARVSELDSRTVGSIMLGGPRR